MAEQGQCPRQEDMELAAKIVIRADDDDGDQLEERAAVAVDSTFYQEKQTMANRRQQIKEQRSEREYQAQEDRADETDGSEPPSVIAVPEEPTEAFWDENDLDSVSQSIQMVRAILVGESEGKFSKAMNQRLQEITEMLASAVAEAAI